MALRHLPALCAMAGMLAACQPTSISGSNVVDGIDFGDDSSEWANDGECDDPRFRGPGMTETTLLRSDIRADATDCLTAYLDGQLTTGGPATSRQVTTSVDFGTDNGDWANDGECDDPRFKGPGMTTTPLLREDVRADATDCRNAYRAGTITLR